MIPAGRLKRTVLALIALAVALPVFGAAPQLDTGWPSASSPGTASAAPAGHASRAGSPRLAEVRYIYRGFGVEPPGSRLHTGRKGESLFNRYFLQTRKAEKASIRFGDGTTIHFNENTDAVLSSPNLTEVRRGEVAEYLAPGTDHKLQTPAAAAGAIGTTFDIEIVGSRSTFTVLHGALQVTNAGITVVVKSNQQTIVTPNRPPQPASPANAADVFAWTVGIPTPDLGEDVALDANGGSIVGVSSQREGPGDAGHAGHINDGLLSQGWETAAGRVTNQWVKVGFLGGNFYRISDVIIDPAATFGDPPSEDLKDFEIRVSSTGTDDASFTTVFRGTCQQRDMLQRFTLPVPVRAKYAELVALDNYGSTRRIAVAEWEVVANTSLFAQPTGIALDGHGNMYVADTNGNRIEKLSPRGSVLAVWGSKGRLPGQFLRPYGVALDGQGNIYVADTFNHRVQKLSPTGRPLAQWGSSGLGRGQFLYPRGIAVDAGGNVYVADIAGNLAGAVGRVQKLSPAGKVLAVWSSLGSAGYFNFPEGIALDRHGNLLVADTDNQRIVKLSPSGKLLATLSVPESGSGQGDAPTGVAADAADNIYVVDSYGARLLKLSSRGKVLASWGTAGLGRGQFLLPYGVALGQGGALFITDAGNSRIQQLDANGRVRAVFGKFATVPQVLGEPAGVAADAAGNVYVTDDLNDRLQVRGPNGQVRAVYGYHGYVALEHRTGLGQFWYPHGVAVDRQGAIYVADTFNSRIQILSNRGPVGAFGQHGARPGQFSAPHGVALDTAGNIYVADTCNDRIQKLSPKGKVLWSRGTRGIGPGQFSLPEGIAVDRAGNIYVSDFVGNRVQKLSPQGKVLAVWGQGGRSASCSDLTVPTVAGGLAAIAGRFTGPVGLAVDGQNNLYVADSGHNVVQKIAPTGAVLNIFPIPGPNASPVAVAVDPRGTIYVADNLNSRIVKLAPTGEVLGIWD